MCTHSQLDPSNMLEATVVYLASKPLLMDMLPVQEKDSCMESLLSLLDLQFGTGTLGTRKQ